MHSLIILFGQPGVGKSYVGKILAEELSYHFYDADIDLTPAMRNSIQQEKIFTQEQRDEYFHLIIKKIQALQQEHPHIAVAQALAKEANRLQLAEVFPTANFVLIHAQPTTMSTRLEKRKDWISLSYAKKIWEIFEHPQITHQVLDNNQGEIHIRNQLQDIILTSNTVCHSERCAQDNNKS